MATINNRLPPNFPTPPTPPAISLLTHPRDLLADERNFYSQIQFIPYDFNLIQQLWYSNSSDGTGVVSSANPTGGVVLPIPLKLNDVQTITWTDVGLMEKGASLASTALVNSATGGYAQYQARIAALQALRGIGSALSIASGYQLNPALWLMFKSPEFKIITLNWQFTATSEQESIDIAKIIEYFKFNSLPAVTLGGAVYEYPSIALVKFYPNNFFTFRLKPCAVLNVVADYTGSGTPSFFKNGAPTVINFAVVLKEIDLWTKNNYDR